MAGENVSERRTRSNPSPTGLKSLPNTTRKFRKPKTSAQLAAEAAADAAASASVSSAFAATTTTTTSTSTPVASAGESSNSTKPKTAVQVALEAATDAAGSTSVASATTATPATTLNSLAPVASSDESSNAEQQLSDSPPTTTSRSQSPLLAESGSQSPLPAESRSTSPPIQNPTARSVSPSMPSSLSNALEQQQEPQSSTRVAAKKRSRIEKGPSTHQGVGADYADESGEQRPAKRTRNRAVDQQEEPQWFTRVAAKKRSRTEAGPSTHQGVGTNYADESGQQRPAKRTRTRNKTESAEAVEEQSATILSPSNSTTSQQRTRNTTEVAEEQPRAACTPSKPTTSSQNTTAVAEVVEEQPVATRTPSNRTSSTKTATEVVEEQLAANRTPLNPTTSNKIVTEVAEVAEEQTAATRTPSYPTSQPRKRFTRPASRPASRKNVQYISSEDEEEDEKVINELRLRCNSRFHSSREPASTLSETPAQSQSNPGSAVEVDKQEPLKVRATTRNISTASRKFVTPKSTPAQAKASKSSVEPPMEESSKNASLNSSFKSGDQSHTSIKSTTLPDANKTPDPPNDPRLRHKYIIEKLGEKYATLPPNYTFDPMENEDKKKLLKDAILLGRKQYAHYDVLDSIEADDEEEEDIIEAEGGDGPEYTRYFMARFINPPGFRREDIPFPIPPQSTDSPETRRKLEAVRPPGSRPSTKIFFNSPTLVIPATSSKKAEILTLSDDHLVAVQALLHYMKSNPSAKVPDSEQVQMLLENFQHVAEATSADRDPLQTSSASANTPDRDQADFQSAENGSSASPDHHTSESEDAESEVEPVIPQTPKPHVQESRIWHGFSTVKDFVTTPFKFLAGQGQDASNGTTNEHSVDNINRHPKTPTHPHNRLRVAAQSERRRTAQTSSSIRRRREPQTERRQRPAEFEKPPIHLRGVYTAEQIAALQRKQDEEAKVALEKERAADVEREEERRTEVRRKQRENQESALEEDRAVVVSDSTQTGTPVEAGKKRQKWALGYNPAKWPYGYGRTENGGFCDPTPFDTDSEDGGSDYNDYDQSMPDVERESPAQAPVAAPPSPTLGIRKVQKRVTFLDEQVASESIRYTSTFFPQPPAVQANIDAGRYPLAPLPTPSTDMASQNVFTGGPQTALASSVVDTATSQNTSITGLPKTQARTIFDMSVDQLRTHAPSLFEMPETWRNIPESNRNTEGTFRVPDSDSDTDTDGEEDVVGGSSAGDVVTAATEAKSQSNGFSLFQQNQFLHSPPQKPRPTNAELPQIPALPGGHRVERAPPAEPTAEAPKAPPPFMLGNYKVTRAETPPTEAPTNISGTPQSSTAEPALAPKYPSPLFSFSAAPSQSPATQAFQFPPVAVPSSTPPMTLGNYAVTRATEPVLTIPTTPQPPATDSTPDPIFPAPVGMSAFSPQPSSPSPAPSLSDMMAAELAGSNVVFLPSAAADLARAKAEIHKPKQPSLLRNVKIMSPSQQELELRERQKREQMMREQEKREQEKREQEKREQEKRDQEKREQEKREQEQREQEQREQEQREQEQREQELRERQEREEDESNKENRPMFNPDELTKENIATYQWLEQRNWHVGRYQEAADLVLEFEKTPVWAQLNPTRTRDQIRKDNGWEVSEVEREVDKHFPEDE